MKAFRRVQTISVKSRIWVTVWFTSRFAYIMPWSQLRFDYDPTTTYRARLLPFDAIQREQKMNMSIVRHSRIVVILPSNRTHIVISITSVVVKCILVSSYRSRVVVESQLWYIGLRYDYDPTMTYRARMLQFDAIRREQKINMSIFRRSRVVVVSQSNRTQIVISSTFVVVECVVASSYRSRIAIVITA